MEWKRKGAARNWLGFASHVAGGALVSWVWWRCGEPGFNTAIAGVAVATVAGMLWEVGGWYAKRWPGSALDILGWPLGALIACVAILWRCGF